MVIAGLPWWRSSWESACQCRGHGFEPWSGRIPHARSSWARAPQLLSLRSGARAPQLLSLPSGARAPQLLSLRSGAREPEVLKLA